MAINRRRLITTEEKILRWWVCFQLAGLILLLVKTPQWLRDLTSAAFLLALYAALIWAAFAIL